MVPLQRPTLKASSRRRCLALIVDLSLIILVPLDEIHLHHAFTLRYLLCVNAVVRVEGDQVNRQLRRSIPFTRERCPSQITLFERGSHARRAIPRRLLRLHSFSGEDRQGQRVHRASGNLVTLRRDRPLIRRQRTTEQIRRATAERAERTRRGCSRSPLSLGCSKRGERGGFEESGCLAAQTSKSLS